MFDGELKMEEEVRDVLKRALLTSGVSKRALSLKCGKNATYIFTYFTKGTPQEFPEEVRNCLGKEFNMSPNDFMSASLRQSQVAPAERGNETMPCYGGTQGRGPYDLHSEDYDTIECPHFLRGVPCFALYIKGDQPYPRFRRGEVIYVDRRSPVNDGDDVVVETVAGTGHLRRFIRMEYEDQERFILTEVYNPAAHTGSDDLISKFPATDIVGMYRVVGVKMPGHERKQQI